MATFVGPESYTAPQYKSPEENLILRPYRAKLGEACKNICKEMLNSSSTVELKPCILELHPALDCVIRRRRNKLGDINNNIFLCRHEIHLSKQFIYAHYSTNQHFHSKAAFLSFDNAIQKIHQQHYSFI